MPENLSIQLDLNSNIFLFKQIACRIEEQIETGRLSPGSKLPSTRKLARDLSVSRATTSAAYAELKRLGLIENATHAGTLVTKRERSSDDIMQLEQGCFSCAPDLLADPPLLDGNRRPPDALGAGAGNQDKNARLPLHFLPAKRWNSFSQKPQRQQLSRRVSEVSVQFGKSNYDEACENRLKQALSRYVLRARGVNTNPHQIVIFGNQSQALYSLASSNKGQWQNVVLEDPADPAVRALFHSLQNNVCSTMADCGGLILDKLPQHGRVDLIYTTPCNQRLFGVSAQAERRAQVLEYAMRHDAYILEDDCDHEFSYGSTRNEALKALDRNNRVIYLTSFKKSLFPLSQISFIVAPEALAHKLSDIKTLIGGQACYAQQNVLAQMLEVGYLERHLMQLRACFAEKRRLLVTCLGRIFGPSVYQYANAMGTTVCVRFDISLAPGRLFSAAVQAGLPVLDASAYFSDKNDHQHLLFSIPHVQESVLESNLIHLQHNLETMQLPFTHYQGVSSQIALPV